LGSKVARSSPAACSPRLPARQIGQAMVAARQRAKGRGTSPERPVQTAELGPSAGADEVAGEDGPACWICLGEDRRDVKLGALRSPCACRGSIGHVHERCLQDWINSQAESADVPGIPTCPTCKERYHGDVLLLLAASSVLRLMLDLPPAAESSLVTELQRRHMVREANALIRRRMRWNVLVADENDPRTLQGICNVAAAMSEIKQHKAAATLSRRVLKHCERILRCSGTAPTGGWLRLWPARWTPDAAALAAAWREGDDDEEAELEHERKCVLLIAQGAVEALADALRRQGRHEEAEQQLQRGRAFARLALAWRCLDLAWMLHPLLAFLLGCFFFIAPLGAAALGGLALFVGDGLEIRKLRFTLVFTLMLLAALLLVLNALCRGMLLWVSPRLLRAEPPMPPLRAVIVLFGVLSALVGAFAHLGSHLAASGHMREGATSVY